MTDIDYETKVSFSRLNQRLQSRYKDYAAENSQDWSVFTNRLKKYFPELFKTLYSIYGGVYDWIYHLEELLYRLAENWIQRPNELKKLDLTRELDPVWFQSENIVGGVCYVDLYAQDLKGLRKRIPYFKELGITYLHLMPLFKSPDGKNDGGYAVSSYREVDPSLGDMKELALLSGELREEGINLVLDFIFNHTSNEHDWATKAVMGEKYYQRFYFIFPDRKFPDRYEKHLREIFPLEHPGAFTYFNEMNSWVWTTFHSYQWDLNYQNPAVFVSMANEMLALANFGVDVLRLDAVAFIWKKFGTSCENLPEVHLLIQAFNLITRIAAPGLALKSEAIVHPDEVAKYIGPMECQLSYNPLLMALLWESLATREVRLLTHSLQKRFAIPEGTTWVNYVRCHDDIGWTFSDEDANELWIKGNDHRKFLNEYYQGRYPGSFARGLPFQSNPITGDSRISGTCASLAGLEKAITVETEFEIELAIQRILMIHGIIMTIGGIPLIYLGDEIGTLNDYSYAADPTKVSDSRWVHRPAFEEARSAKRKDADSVEGKIFKGIKQVIQLRKNNPIFADQNTEIMDTGNPHVFCYGRKNSNNEILVLGNFSESQQTVLTNEIEVVSAQDHRGDEYWGTILPEIILLEPYEFMLIDLMAPKNR